MKVKRIDDYITEITRQDGKTFRFHFNHIGHAMWVMELLAAGDEEGFLSYSDPFPNERAARAYSQDTIDNWYRDPRYGWCQK